MSKISVVIIEDEPKAIDILKRYLADISDMELLGTFRDPVKGLEFLHRHTVDLLLLDINMPKLSGLEVLEAVTNRPYVIFTTAYTDYAVESYNYDAIDYLVKPIEYARFLKAIHKVKDKISGSLPVEPRVNQSMLNIKSGTQVHRVHESSVLYMEKDGNYVVFHLKDKKILSRYNMKDIYKLVNPGSFVRVHKSFVVNISAIEVIESDQVTVGGHVLPVGRSYREEVMRLT